MSSSEKKKRKTSKKNEPSPVLLPTPESTPNPSLPDDLLLSCFSRVSRSYYPTLSLVSRSFRSLLASPELYQARSSLGNTDSCLYVYLAPYWYTLCRKHNPTITNDTSTTNKKKKKPCGYVLAAVQAPSPPPASGSGVVAVGSNIYNIGGRIDDENEASTRVSILDCRSHTWQEGPSMHLKRNRPAANVVDGKIYVAGGCKGCNASNWMEVFDPKKQTWELVSCPGAETCGCLIKKSAGIDGKVYVVGNRSDLAYNPKNGTSERVGGKMSYSSSISFSIVIGNVLYHYYTGVYKWYDTKARLWRNLMGVKGGPTNVKLADYGGKMAMLWHKDVHSRKIKTKKRRIRCAVIALERRNNDEEIWGTVEWYGAVLRVSKSRSIEYVVSATL